VVTMDSLTTRSPIDSVPCTGTSPRIFRDNHQAVGSSAGIHNTSIGGVMSQWLLSLRHSRVPCHRVLRKN